MCGLRLRLPFRNRWHDCGRDYGRRFHYHVNDDDARLSADPRNSPFCVIREIQVRVGARRLGRKAAVLHTRQNPH